MQFLILLAIQIALSTTQDAGCNNRPAPVRTKKVCKHCLYVSVRRQMVDPDQFTGQDHEDIARQLWELHKNTPVEDDHAIELYVSLVRADGSG